MSNILSDKCDFLACILAQPVSKREQILENFTQKFPQYTVFLTTLQSIITDDSMLENERAKLLSYLMGNQLNLSGEVETKEQSDGNKLQRRVMEAIQNGCSIYYYNEPDKVNNYSDLVNCLQNPEYCSLDDFFKTINLTTANVPVTPTSENLQLDQHELYQQEKQAYERELSSEDTSEYVCTKNSNKGCPIFTQFDNKPDRVMKSFPAFLDMKQSRSQEGSSGALINSHYAVLAQVLERIVITMSMCAYLSVFIGFAVTGNKCWIVVFRRFYFDDNLTEKVTFFPVTADVLHQVWWRISLFGKKHPQWYFNEDAPIIRSFLDSFGYPPECCRTELLSTSSSAVYRVTFPSQEPPPQGVIQQLSNSPHLAIKIHHNKEKFHLEKDALNAIAAYVHNFQSQLQKTCPPYSDFQFYALGYFDDSVHWFPTTHEKFKMNFVERKQSKSGSESKRITRSTSKSLVSPPLPPLPPPPPPPPPPQHSPSLVNSVHAPVWWDPPIGNLSSGSDEGGDGDENQGGGGGGGGAIIMQIGSDEQANLQNIPEVEYGIQTCLHFTHRAGYVHRDIRRYNAVKFHNSCWQLIDYDFSCQIGTKVTLNEEDNQYKAAGIFVHSHNPVGYEWTIDDDYQMLFEMGRRVRNNL